MKLPWVITAIWAGVFWVGASRAEAVILINEVLADPPALVGDANGDGIVSTTQDEFVELVNTDADAVSLADWSLRDSIQVRHVFAPSAIIAGYGFYVVFGGGSIAGWTDAALASTGGLSLNNAGDTVTLLDESTGLIDQFIYGSEGGMDVSLTRFPDGVGAFVKHTAVSQARFSPGETTDGASRLPHSSAHPTIPEPSSVLLLGVGLFGMFSIGRPRRA